MKLSKWSYQNIAENELFLSHSTLYQLFKLFSLIFVKNYTASHWETTLIGQFEMTICIATKHIREVKHGVYAKQQTSEWN